MSRWVATAALIAVMSLSFSPGHKGATAILSDASGFNTDSTQSHSFRLVDVTPRITDSGYCHFFLREGEVLFIDPGYRVGRSAILAESNKETYHFQGLILNQNITQLFNTKFLYHE